MDIGKETRGDTAVSLGTYAEESLLVRLKAGTNVVSLFFDCPLSFMFFDVGCRPCNGDLTVRDLL